MIFQLCIKDRLWHIYLLVADDKYAHYLTVHLSDEGLQRHCILRKHTNLHVCTKLNTRFSCSCWIQCHEHTWSGCILIWEVIIGFGAAAVTAGVSVREVNPFNWILTNLFPGIRTVPHYSKTILRLIHLNWMPHNNHNLIFKVKESNRRCKHNIFSWISLLMSYFHTYFSSCS